MEAIVTVTFWAIVAVLAGIVAICIAIAVDPEHFPPGDE